MSNIKCCVPGCENSGGSHVPLHKFPNPKKDLTLFNTWLSAIGGPILELENSHIFKYRRVCHQHFEEKYWCRNNRLSNIAEPTLNMPGSVTLPEPAAGERRPLVSIEHLTEPSTSKGSLTLPVPAAGERRPLVSIENLTKPSTSKGSLTLPVPAAGERRPLVSIENLTKPSTSKGSLTLPEPAAGERRPLVSIENLTEPSTSKELHTEESLKVTAHTQKRLSASPAEHHLYQRIIKLGVKLSKYRNKNKKHMMKLKTLQNMTTNPHFQKVMDTMTSTAKILTYMQFRESKKKNKGHRFTLQEKILSLSILKQSPKGYRFLRKIFVLPAPQTLLKLLQQADINPGINENILNQIKKVTRKLKIEERLCIVIFDEMSLKANVTYNERKDRVTGFVNNGHETKPDYADHAQVFMIRGLIKNYKQPVAYTFSQAATKGPELAKQLKSIIIQLQDAGLMVVATVCDQGTNNVQCYKILLQETQTALLRKGQEPRENKFIVNGYEIVPLYDPPHLMKCIRNNLLTKDLQYKKNKQCKTAKWQHIRNLHDENPGYQGIRLVPKLTDSHVIPSKISKMKVKYATQVFSQTVATNMGYLADKGILPPECRDTADVLLFFDALFDSVNGSYNKKQKHGKPLLGAATPRSAHHETWRESKKILKDMKFINTSGQKEHVPTLQNWVWTLEGIEVLLKNLKENYSVTSVWLRHLNQDPLENFFGAIRSHGCRNVNPTPEKFESAFTTLLVNNLNVHAPGANCEEDQCEILNELIISKCNKAQPTCDIDSIPDIQITPIEEKRDVRQVGGLQYVCGYFIKKTQTNVFKGCTQCKNDLMSKNEPEYIRYREYAGKKWLCSPSNSLLLCVSNLQDINYTIIKSNLDKKNLKELIKTLAISYIEFDFIKCENHRELIVDYLINISCRFFIYNYCKDINKILTNKRECDDDEDSFKIKAKKYYNKCYKRKNK